MSHTDDTDDDVTAEDDDADDEPAIAAAVAAMAPAGTAAAAAAADSLVLYALQLAHPDGWGHYRRIGASKTKDTQNSDISVFRPSSQ